MSIQRMQIIYQVIFKIKKLEIKMFQLNNVLQFIKDKIWYTKGNYFVDDKIN